MLEGLQCSKNNLCPGQAKRHPRRAESPRLRLAQGKRSDTLGWVIVSNTIYALKGQKRGYCVLFRIPSAFMFYAFALSGRGYYIFVSHTQGAASLALG